MFSAYPVDGEPSQQINVGMRIYERRKTNIRNTHGCDFRQQYKKRTKQYVFGENRMISFEYCGLRCELNRE